MDRKDEVCPDCKGPVTYYHGPESITRVVCRDKCRGWHVIKEYDNSPRAK